jgi:hypothetical protein
MNDDDPERASAEAGDVGGTDTAGGMSIASSGGITKLHRVIDMVQSDHTPEEIAAWSKKEIDRLAKKAPQRAKSGKTRRVSKDKLSLIPLLGHVQLPHLKECQGSTEVTVEHQPKHCQASPEDKTSSINRSNPP